ncbi:CDP-glycerol glycerophosphotransferase family protein [Denitrobacterium detoxificans]|uniref:CDP-glycerol glycerophosphotransferase family protein n=1 Tax=Denitrobacterium detoxificans TaxID=79604 RepID=UPI0026EB29F1|nr:CDP-glycerol glycerophosphotransferase family protein [Denitrobacterium detoxificans]MBE6466951.1 glycosyltransferase [Denitrobacterium detoxificans]
MITLSPGKKKTQRNTKAESFTFICAVYNTEPYLDRLFESILLEQNYPIERIHIIAINDGSQDGSLAKLEEWQKRFPKNITIRTQENAGQGAARNLGMQLAQTEWIAFIDSDDFINQDYLKIANTNIQGVPDLQAIFTSNIAYRESSDKFKNSHFMKYRFKNGDSIFDFDDENMYPEHSASTAFFRKSIIEQNGIAFPTDIRTSFEDSLFVGEYLRSLTSGKVLFAANAKYYARRRADNSSVTSNSFDNPAYYLDCLERGNLALLKMFESKPGAHIPKNIQLTVLYDLVWRIKYLIDGASHVACLTSEQEARFVELLQEIFDHIDVETIMSAEPTIYWYFHKVGLLALFKNELTPSRRAYIHTIDFASKTMVIRTFEKDPIFKLGETIVAPVSTKRVKHTFLDKVFAYEYLYVIPFENANDRLVITSSIDETTFIVSRKSDTSKKMKLRTAFQGYVKKWRKYKQKGNLWMLSDGVNKADDNAEHLYRHIMNNHPEQDMMYVLERTSPDWGRLKAEGFNLVAFGSKKYERALRRASTIVSSQISPGTSNYWKDQFGHSKRTVFLQHGVTKDDISSYINNAYLDLVICVTKPELASFQSDDGKYLYTKDTFQLTGFPRHDALVAARNGKKNLLLIAPTWRKSLVGGSKSISSARDLKDGFFESDYAINWGSLMGSEELRQFAERNGLEIVFCPHPNMRQVINDERFTKPEWITIDENAKYQDLLKKTAVLFTDYSSLAFDAAIAGSAVYYFQFDAADFFSGSHSYKKGYFDYRTDGFGPVFDDLEELKQHLASSESICPDAVMYSERVSNTFTLDTNASERTYQAIASLKSSYEEGMKYNDSALKKKAKAAKRIAKKAKRTLAKN